MTGHVLLCNRQGLGSGWPVSIIQQQARIQDFLQGGGGGVVNDGRFFFAIVKKFVEKKKIGGREQGGDHDHPPTPTPNPRIRA